MSCLRWDDPPVARGTTEGRVVPLPGTRVPGGHNAALRRELRGCAVAEGKILPDLEAATGWRGALFAGGKVDCVLHDGGARTSAPTPT